MLTTDGINLSAKSAKESGIAFEIAFVKHKFKIKM